MGKRPARANGKVQPAVIDLGDGQSVSLSSKVEVDGAWVDMPGADDETEHFPNVATQGPKTIYTFRFPRAAKIFYDPGVDMGVTEAEFQAAVASETQEQTGGSVTTTAPQTEAEGNTVTNAPQTDAEGNTVTNAPQTDADGNGITTATPTDAAGPTTAAQTTSTETTSGSPSTAASSAGLHAVLSSVALLLASSA